MLNEGDPFGVAESSSGRMTREPKLHGVARSQVYRSAFSVINKEKVSDGNETVEPETQAKTSLSLGSPDVKPSASLDLANGQLTFTVTGTPDITPTNFPIKDKNELTATLCITSADFAFLCSTGSSDPDISSRLKMRGEHRKPFKHFIKNPLPPTSGTQGEKKSESNRLTASCHTGYITSEDSRPQASVQETTASTNKKVTSFARLSISAAHSSLEKENTEYEISSEESTLPKNTDSCPMHSQLLKCYVKRSLSTDNRNNNSPLIQVHDSENTALNKETKSKLDMKAVKSFISLCKSFASNQSPTIQSEEADTESFTVNPPLPSLCTSCDEIQQDFLVGKHSLACHASCLDTRTYSGIPCEAALANPSICTHETIFPDAEGLHNLPLCAMCSHLLHPSLHSSKLFADCKNCANLGRILSHCRQSRPSECLTCKIHSGKAGASCNLCALSAHPSRRICPRECCRTPSEETLCTESTSYSENTAHLREPIDPATRKPETPPMNIELLATRPEGDLSAAPNTFLA